MLSQRYAPFADITYSWADLIKEEDSLYLLKVKISYLESKLSRANFSERRSLNLKLIKLKRKNKNLREVFNKKWSMLDNSQDTIRFDLSLKPRTLF